MRFLLALCLIFSFAVPTFAQCENGVCRRPSRFPILNAVGCRCGAACDCGQSAGCQCDDANCRAALATPVRSLVRELRPVRRVAGAARVTARGIVRLVEHRPRLLRRFVARCRGGCR